MLTGMGPSGLVRPRKGAGGFMPIDDISSGVAAIAADAKLWRHDFHTHPELMYDVERTAGKVAELLGSFGVDEVVTGIGRTGVVAVIKGRTAADAPLASGPTWMPCRSWRKTGKPYASRDRWQDARLRARRAHRHAARGRPLLCETRNFAGTAVVVFQPAEEGGAGGRPWSRMG